MECRLLYSLPQACPPELFCLCLSFPCIILFHGLIACKLFCVCSCSAGIPIILLILHCVFSPNHISASVRHHCYIHIVTSLYSCSHLASKFLLAIQSSQPHCQFNSNTSSRTPILTRSWLSKKNDEEFPDRNSVCLIHFPDSTCNKQSTFCLFTRRW